MSEPSIRTGAEVSFKLGETVCPDLEQVLTQITPELELSGRVVFFSDYGEHKDHFAIVDVGGLLSPVIVPVSQLRPVIRMQASQTVST